MVNAGTTKLAQPRNPTENASYNMFFTQTSPIGLYCLVYNLYRELAYECLHCRLPEMDTKLALLATLLAVIDAFVPLSFGYASCEYLSVPSTPVLVLLAALVKLLLLLLPAFHHDTPSSGRELSLRHRQQQGSKQRQLDSSVKACPNFDSASCIYLDVQHSNKQQQLDTPLLHKHLHVPSSDGSRLSASSGPSSGGGYYSSGSRTSYWQLLVVSAVCSTVASNIMLSLLPSMAPYAWSQLALLQVVIMTCFACNNSNNSSSKLRAHSSTGAQAALCMLFVAVCMGQGVFGGRPTAPLAGPNDTSVQVIQEFPAHTELGAGSILGWGTLAAVLGTLAAHLLLLAQDAGQQQQVPQQGLCIVQCVMVALCSFLWFLVREGELESMFDDIMPPHWHAVLLLGVSGFLSTAVASWPAEDAIIAKGYAFQGAVVLAAWGSSMVLDAPQGAFFACCSFLSGVSVLLLHNGMHADPSTHGEAWQSSGKGQHGSGEQLSKRLFAACRAKVKVCRINWRALRDTLSCFWAAVTVFLLALTCWAQLVHNGRLDRFSFSHPASAQAIQQLGITSKTLMACSDAPFPVAQLYHSSIVAAQRAVAAAEAAATGKASTNVTAAVAASPLRTVPLVAADDPAPAWELCPSLTCSRDPSCTSRNTSCCAHLHVQMAAFWDAFMHSNGLSRQYTVLYDTLAETLDTGAPSAGAAVMHMGVSAQAIAVLERPCLKTKAWQHGYTLFLQGSTWRMCAHRQHPSPIVRQHMHPVRHLTPHIDAGSAQLHVMWPYQGAQQDGQHSAQLDAEAVRMMAAAARTRWSLRGEAVSAWRLCLTGEVLSTGAGLYVSMDGLQMPRPVGAELSTTNSSWASPAVGSPTFSRRAARECERLVGELLAHIEV